MIWATFVCLIPENTNDKQGFLDYSSKSWKLN